MKNTTWTLSALAAAAALTLTSCADGGTEPDESEASQAEATQTESTHTESADDTRIQSSQEDVWARTTDSEMTSVFGTIENLTDEDLTVVAASSEVAGIMELHEIVEEDGQQIMQQIEGGFTIPASGALELETGGDHLMLMDLQQELLPGEVLEIALEFEDGTQESIEAMVRDDGGQDEPYEHGEDMEGMDHGDEMDHGDDMAEMDHGEDLAEMDHGDADDAEGDHDSDDHEH